jgi:hypothetical protein
MHSGTEKLILPPGGDAAVAPFSHGISVGFPPRDRKTRGPAGYSGLTDSGNTRDIQVGRIGPVTIHKRGRIELNLSDGHASGISSVETGIRCGRRL